MRSAMEHKYPDVPFILDALPEAWWFYGTEGDPLLEDDHFESIKQAHGQRWESKRLSWQRPMRQQHTFSPTQYCVWEEAQCGNIQEHLKAGGWKIAEKADQPPQKASKRNSSFANSNVNPCSTFAQLPATIKQHVSSTLGQECVPEAYLPPYHLHGVDERVGDLLQAAQEPRKRVTTQRASSQATGFSLAQDQKRPGVTTSGKPNTRTATGTAKGSRYSVLI